MSIKYIDENGNEKDLSSHLFETSTQYISTRGGETYESHYNLDDMLYKEIWNGSKDYGANVQIPSRSSGNYVTINLADDITKYREIIFVRDSYVYHRMISTNTDELSNRYQDAQLFAWNSSDWGNELVNGFGLHVKVLSGNKIQLGGNFLCQVNNSGGLGVNITYDGNWLNNIIGVKRPYERVLPFLK